MLTLKPRKEIVFYTFLIVAILVNTLAPIGRSTYTVQAQGQDLTSTPTETATPVPVTETPSPTPTATIQSPEPEVILPETNDAPSYSLTLGSEPSFLNGSGILNLNWMIEGDLTTETQLTLEISLPAGFEPKNKQESNRFDPATGLFTTSVSAAQGHVQVQAHSAQADALFSARLLNGTEVLAATSLIVPLQEQFDVSANGGSIQTLNDKLKVTIPAGALSEDVIVQAGFPTADHLPDGFSPKVFELTAHAKGNPAAEIDHFNTLLTLEVDYSDLQLTEKQEDELFIYWYNEQTGDWHALESFADKNTKTVRAYTDHFTVFDIGVNDWRAERLPTTESFQVSQFTGAATFSLPMQVPPGPGGFQPNVTLSYNSQVVDQATKKAQASWAGMGWSVDGGGSITENGDGGGYMLVVNGISTQLIREAQNGNYHAMEENFWKIVRVNNSTDNYWKVLDTQGNIYFFDTQAKYADHDQVSGATVSKPYAWYLTSVTNTSGQQITYTYYFQRNYNIHGQRTDSAVYVDKITYANGRIRVRFERGIRDDYVLAYDTDPVVHLYEKKNLDSIVIEQDADADGTFEKLVRKYDFTYIGETGTTTTDRIWPEINYSAGGKTLTLRSVQEWSGWDGAAWQNGLPPYTFTYDNLHLTSATNGYGGTVTFTYESQPWYSTTTPDSYEVNSPTCGGWLIYSSTSSGCNVEIEFQEFTLTNGEVSKNILSGSTVGLRPGGVYEVTFTGTKTTGSVVRVGLMYRTTLDSAQFHSGFSYIVNPLNKTASTARAFFKTTGTGTFTNVKVRLLPSFYRVTQKTVSDGNGNSYVTGYSYQNPKFVAADYEFRGHGIVTETAADGTITKTIFYQDDARKGQVQQVEVFAPNGTTLRSKTVSVYGKTALTEYPASSKYEHAWVHLDSRSMYLYDSNGAQIGGTKTNFTYETSYGNLITKQEYDNPDGSGTPYRTATLTYTTARNTSALYIVSALARQQVKDGSGNLLTDTLYFYNDSTTNGAMPLKNILTMTRTLMDAGQYAQMDYAYDTWGNQTSVTTYTGLGTATNAPTVGAATTTTTYDAIFHAYPVSTTNALNQTVQMDYDYARGVPTCESELLTSISSPCSNTPGHTSAEYDTFGRLAKLIRPGDDANSPTLEISYQDSFPFTTSIEQKINSETSYKVTRQYDGMGREFFTDSGGVKVSTIYENVTTTKQTLPYEGAAPEFFTTTTIDPSTLTTTVSAPNGTVTTSTTNGLITTVTDARGNATITTSDVWGRVVTVTPPTGPGVNYTYDELNHLKTATRGGTGVELFYDNAGHKTKMIDPDMGTWTYTYDALGNLTTQTDARLCVLTWSYDLANRLSSKDSSGSSCGTQVSTTYTYDVGTNGIGQRTSMTDASGSTAWTYDARGRLLSESKALTGAGTFDTSWAYNTADLPISMTYPDGEVVAYNYNSRMLLEGLRDTNGTPGDPSADYSYVAATTYDSSNRITSRELGNGLSQTYTYYPWDTPTQGGRLQNITTGSLQNIDYTYDAVGNLSQITDNLAGETNTYGYDALDRMTGWTLNSGTPESYRYDTSSGNLVSKANTNLTYNAQVSCSAGDRAIPHAVSAANTNTYTYDCNGNQITRVIGADTFNLLYDAENRLVEVKQNDSTIAQFTFDGDGNRVKSTIDGTTTYFVGAHYEVSDSTVTKYYFAGPQRVAMRSNDTLFYLLTDHLGSTSLTTDPNGALVSEMRYNPWGETRYTTGATPTDYTYTGQYSNMSDFGLMFYNARWYDPSLGRFAQADTIIPEQTQGVQAWDRYAYSNNNPVRYTDPSGHCLTDPFTFFVCAMVVGAVIDGGINAYSQYQETGQIDAGQVFEHAVEGAVIGGGVVAAAVVVAATAEALVPAVAVAGAGACADGDCTNEVVALEETASSAVQAVSQSAQNTVRSQSTAIVPYYPPNMGAVGEIEEALAPEGQILSRIGGLYGHYFAPQGTPMDARALPYGAENLTEHLYRVVRPFTYYASKAAPWFGKPGGGIQYRTLPNVKWLLDNGYLEDYLP
jgi:RHS repeat-associated protein